MRDEDGIRATLVDPTSLLQYDFGPSHPFKIYRLGLTYALMAAYGLTEYPGVRIRTPRAAADAEAATFHEERYLETLRLADSGLFVPNRHAHGLGTPDNPVFPGVYEWAMAVGGASIDCARDVAQGEVLRAFNPAGGLHHAMPDRASGFCHVNDAALAIHALLDAGKRVAYVDIDAHHGDGVEYAFYDRNDVLTLSVHQSGYTIFPGSGFVEDVGTGPGEGFSINVPLLPGSGDAAYAMAMEDVVLPAVEAFSPDVLVTQLGADAIAGDVVANLQMSLRRFEICTRQFRDLGLPWVALGGGGYDVSNVVRAWTLAWATMIDVDLPDELPAAWLADAARYGVRPPSLRGAHEETETLDAALEALRETIGGLRSTALASLRAPRP